MAEDDQQPELAQKIRQEIRASAAGSIPFSRFMDLALYDPQHGYYAAGADQRVGRGGDFFTSVSVGECFGKLLATHFLNAQPELRQIVEQGANDGQLAADLLAHLPPEVDYTIIEPFPALRERQQARLGDRVNWAGSLGEIEGGVRGRFICNELLDAFPVQRLRRVDGEWVELHVDPELETVHRPVTDPALADEIDTVLAHRDLPDDYTTELHLEANAWTRQLVDHLRPGARASIIDYGHHADDYYSPERSEGTFRGFRQHRPVDDVFRHIGSTDLTASVNFSRIAEIAGAAPAVDQHHFFIEAARPWFAEIESGGTAPDAATIPLLRQFNTLIHPGLMGQSFKVLEIER